VTAAVIALAVLAAGLGAGLVTLALKYRSDTGKLTADLVASGKREIAVQLNYDRAAFELEVIREQLAKALKKADGLDRELADARKRTSLGAGLAPSDVDGRVQRIASRDEAAGDPIPAVPVAGPVPERTVEAASGSARPGVHALRPIDVLK
jgi:hypothetical protein